MTYRMPGLVWMLGTLLALWSARPLAAQDSGWKLEPDARIEVLTISAQTTTRDNDLVIDGEAISLRGQVGLALNSKRTRLRVGADRIEVFRLGEGRRNTSRDRLTASVEHDITAKLELQLQARRCDDLVTVESADSDEWQGSARRWAWAIAGRTSCLMSMMARW
jgi:hypothetical protein